MCSDVVCFQRTSAHHLHDVWPTDTEKRGNLVRAELFVLFDKCDARASIESGEHSGDDSAHRALGWKRLDGGGQLVDIVLFDGGALQDRGSVHGSTPNCNNCNASRGGREASISFCAVTRWSRRSMSAGRPPYATVERLILPSRATRPRGRPGSGRARLGRQSGRRERRVGSRRCRR
ncbi:hypothetical protein ACFPRL_10075 [Pseudoclavibacter helvolus]